MQRNAGDGTGGMEPIMTFSLLHVIPNAVYNAMTSAEKLLFSALQGLASRGPKAIYCVSNNFNDLSFEPLAADFWLQKIDIKQEAVEDYWKLLTSYKNINHYILCDIENNGDSVNIATSLSGILGAIPVDVSLKDRVESLKFNMVEDVTKWKFDKFLKKYSDSISKSMAVELNPNIFWGPRDYAVANQAVVIYGATQRASILTLLEAPAPIYGWGPTDQFGEKAFITDVGKAGDYYVAADAAFNLTVFNGLDVSPTSVPAAVSSFPAGRAQPKKKVYVAFMMSDGDNLQWLLNRGNCSNWWGNSSRGTLPVGWTFSPSLYNLAPAIWNYYVGTKTENDEIICGPSGIGYVFDNIAQSDNFVSFLSLTEKFMSDANINLVSVFGNQYPNSEYLQGYADQDAVSGVMYVSYTPWVVPNSTALNKYNNKTVIPMNINLDGDVNVVAKKILGNPPSPPFYMVYVNAWGSNGDNDPWALMNGLYDALKDKNVEFVLPSVLFSMAESHS
ncbi:GxGYxYP domain-containing protein [Nitrospirillum pindoramense]|nr:GxGYxYP domain-containing protein [Nitrospirillum amazonense]